MAYQFQVRINKKDAYPVTITCNELESFTPSGYSSYPYAWTCKGATDSEHFVHIYSGNGPSTWYIGEIELRITYEVGTREGAIYIYDNVGKYLGRFAQGLTDQNFSFFHFKTQEGKDVVTLMATPDQGKISNFPINDGWRTNPIYNSVDSTYVVGIIKKRYNTQYSHTDLILGLTPDRIPGYDAEYANSLGTRFDPAFGSLARAQYELDYQTNLLDFAALPIPPRPKPEGVPVGTLFFNKSETNKVSKELVSIAEYKMTFNRPMDILNPVIDIKTDDIPNIVQNANYMYIDQLARYYFITGIEILRTDLIRITGRVDVLMTYATQIKSQKAIVARNYASFNLMLNDPNFEFQANPIIKTKRFPNYKNFLNDYFEMEPHYVLVISGR